MVNNLVSRKFSNAYRMKTAVIAGAIGLAALTIPSTQAATDTANLSVQLIVSSSCAIGTVSNLNFGTAATPLTANIDVSTSLDVTCSNGTTYDIGLNAGTTAGGSIATRLMFNAGNGEDVAYRMYTDAGRTANWGNTVGADTVNATGNGASQSYTIYGRVPPQTTPTAATYTDTVTVTVTY